MISISVTNLQLCKSSRYSNHLSTTLTYSMRYSKLPIDVHKILVKHLPDSGASPQSDMPPCLPEDQIFHSRTPNQQRFIEDDRNSLSVSHPGVSTTVLHLNSSAISAEDIGSYSR